MKKLQRAVGHVLLLPYCFWGWVFDFFCGVEVLKSVGDIEERNIDRFVGNRSLEYAEVLLTHSLNWLFEEKHDYSSLLI